MPDRKRPRPPVRKGPPVPERPLSPEEQAALEARIDAMLSAHSGHPTVTVQQWALLVRANSDKPVPLEEVVASFLSWFRPTLSAEELKSVIFSAEDKKWVRLDLIDGEQVLHTTPLGVEVLRSVDRPLMMGGVFKLTGHELVEAMRAAASEAAPVQDWDRDNGGASPGSKDQD